MPRLVTVRSWDIVARDLIGAHKAWRVHSVFASAFNLVSADGTLLGIVAAPASNAPATLVLETEARVPCLTAGLRPGDSVRLVLDLSKAVLWSPGPIIRTLPADDVRARLSRAAHIGSSLAPDDGFGVLLHGAYSLAEEAPSYAEVVVKAGRTYLGNLSDAIRRQDWSAAMPAAQGLSGLGPGLTPSGDDLLAGLALGYRSGHGTLPERLATTLLAAVDGRTTDLAVARVQHAVAGRPDEATHRLLAALLGGSGEDLEVAVRGVVAYGHSSGADTLVGLIAGVALGLTVPRPDGPT